MKKTAIGQKEDFVTSPEISQIFGEIIGVYILNEWLSKYNNQPFNLVELGPGHGTLMRDLQRTFRKFPSTTDKFRYNMIEISPKLKKIQQQNLIDINNKNSINWYEKLENLPIDIGPYCFIANEFFDALPFYKLQKTKDGWRQVLIGLNPEQTDLTYVLSSKASYLSSFIKENETRDHVEISPEIGSILKIMCDRLSENGGFALICDYGHLGDKSDTFRAFKNHEIQDPLSNPGECDLTADVDFEFCLRILRSYNEKLGKQNWKRNKNRGKNFDGETLDKSNLKYGDYTDVNRSKTINDQFTANTNGEKNDRLEIIGPIDQRQFLLENGAALRLQMLLNKLDLNKDPDTELEKEKLMKNFEVLVGPNAMGNRFKFLIIKSR
ncbi:unnamed protein product [Gordionus sp. m RMFG-2023]|uniref:protein arginine methyltransferase NDUFAF7, mitochondrial-like isoform X1 n=2 Tax=Gordionus sp. m RMFG-2023 TaxID=3053472 RepID=UPI0030E33A53